MANVAIRVPRTVAEALKEGFEGSGAFSKESKDCRHEYGVYDFFHQDGRWLRIPFRAKLTFGKPKLNRRLTRAYQDRLAHPENYDEDGLRLKKAAPKAA